MDIMKGKKIIIVTSLFYPEIAANSKRMTHLALELREKGADVSVITALPYYPTSRLSFKQNKWFSEEQYKGIKIIKSYIFSNKYKNIFKRLLSFLSFMASSILASFRIRGNVDAVIAISPPFTTLFSGYVISRLKKGAFIADIQDIYPDTLVALGFLKNRIIIFILKGIEKFFYKKAAGIAVISAGFQYNIIHKGAKGNVVNIIPNWADIDLFKPVQKKSLKRNINTENKFVVMFAGTIGFAQGLEKVIECGNLIGEYEEKIMFIFLGDGVERENLINAAERFNLKNILFLPPVVNSALPEYLAEADACLVYLRKNKLYRIIIPCKIYEYMAMAKPVIVGVEGEASQLIKKAGCGLCIEPESPDDLAQAVLKLYNNKKLCLRMGKNGRKYVTANFSKGQILSKYTRLIINSVNIRSRNYLKNKELVYHSK